MMMKSSIVVALILVNVLVISANKYCRKLLYDLKDLKRDSSEIKKELRDGFAALKDGCTTALDCDDLPCVEVTTPDATEFSGVYEKTDLVCHNATVYNLAGTSRYVVRMKYDTWWVTTIASCPDYSSGYAWIEKFHDSKLMQCPGDVPFAQLHRGGSDADIPGSVVGLRGKFLKKNYLGLISIL